MAVLHPLYTSFTTKPHHLLYKPLSSTLISPKFTIISQDSSSQSSKPTIKNDSVSENSQPNSSTGLGFGPTQPPKSSNKKGKRDRGPIIRRSPVERPAFLDKKGGVESNSEEQSVNERAFLITWLGLGVLILVEGLTLSASGFLPEEWDKFLVKYLYPVFTPTVFLFVAGTVVYGIIKYFENEDVSNKN